MPDTTATPPTADPSADPLMMIVIAFLAPMFLWAGDVALARAVAIETLNAYRIVSHRSLITAAKIIAYELAALSSLSQSMAEDIAVSLALRLRSNANSMDRAAERNRAALEQEQRAAASAAKTAHLTEEAAAAAVAPAQKAVRDAKVRAHAAPPAVTMPPVAPSAVRPAPAVPPAIVPTSTEPSSAEPPPAAPPAPAPEARTPAARPVPATQAHMPATRQQWQTAWADAMAEVAAEFTAGLATLPPAERAAEMIRIRSLTETASRLAAGAQVSFTDIPGLDSARPAGP